jgi:hypothetical protein
MPLLRLQARVTKPGFRLGCLLTDLCLKLVRPIDNFTLLNYLPHIPSCWRDAMQEEINAQEKRNKTWSHCLQGNKPLAIEKQM